MGPASSSYNFVFAGGVNHTYLFESRFGASYEVRFKPGPELVDDAAFGDYIFELVIALVGNPYAPKLPPVDAQMSSTIARIVAHFLSTREQVVVYVCDDADSRSDARRKLFDGWFRRFSQKLFIKMQLPIGPTDDPDQYSIEFVTRFDNPYIMDIYVSFRRKIMDVK